MVLHKEERKNVLYHFCSPQTPLRPAGAVFEGDAECREQLLEQFLGI